jgi:hypothetical protein
MDKTCWSQSFVGDEILLGYDAPVEDNVLKFDFIARQCNSIMLYKVWVVKTAEIVQIDLLWQQTWF